MTRQQLEHVIRAAAATSNQKDIVVIGSQAVLGTLENASGVLAESMEADVFPKDDPALSIVIDGAIGELSTFHQTFGYYAHGVSDRTAVLPVGWRDRLVRISSPALLGAVGWCLDVHDLAVSKLIAGREKDVMFVEALFGMKAVSLGVLSERLGQVEHVAEEVRRAARAKLSRWQPKG